MCLLFNQYKDFLALVSLKSWEIPSMFRACPNAFHKPTNHAVYVCFVPVFSLSLLSKSFVLMPCFRDWTPVRVSPMIPRRSIIPNADVRKQKPNRESDDNDQSRGKCTPPSRLTIEVMSLPREEMFEILDSGCLGRARCWDGRYAGMACLVSMETEPGDAR
jgi:hypothetical protein